MDRANAQLAEVTELRAPVTPAQLSISSEVVTYSPVKRQGRREEGYGSFWLCIRD